MLAANDEQVQMGLLTPDIASHAAFERGIALHHAGLFEQAADAFQLATQHAPRHADAFHNLGASLMAARGPAEAIPAWQQALRLHPDRADSLAALGGALLDAGREEEAAMLLSGARPGLPLDARVVAVNGRALLALGYHGPALGALHLALEMQPGNAAAHAALGSALHDTGDFEQGLAHSLEAFRLAPDAQHATGLSRALSAVGHYQEALTFAGHALSLDPGAFAALTNRALALRGLGRFEDSLAAGQQALAATPHDPAARHNLAMLHLGLGQLTAEAWDLFESRLLLKGKPARLAAPGRWAGEDMAGRTLLLHAEQGLGDTLQFVRYAPLAAARGARVVLAVQPPLLRLLRATPGVHEAVPVDEPLPPHDMLCPLLSLPRVFGTTLDSIPPPLPYAGIAPPPGLAPAALRVGLVWEGGKIFARDRQRSLAAADLAGLAGIGGVQFYSLQRHEGAPAALPPSLGIIDLMAGVTDFAETAALVAGLDLVVAVDTAVAHLAATMGKPVWLLSRFDGCWRWLHGRADTPWYPSMRIVRQERPNEWGGALAQVRQGLQDLARRPRP